MSEISDIMPAVNALLTVGQMPSADQVRRMLVVIDKQDAEIERLHEALKPTTGLCPACEATIELKDGHIVMPGI